MIRFFRHSFSALLEQRRVALIASRDWIGAQVPDALDEMEEEREERDDIDETSETIDSGDEADEVDRAREERRIAVG